MSRSFDPKKPADACSVCWPTFAEAIIPDYRLKLDESTTVTIPVCERCREMLDGRATDI